MVSGTLGDSFMNISQILESSMSSKLSKITGLLEPVMMILLGTIVGAISLSIMLPIYDISTVLQKAH
jgi:type II secretory pathway component PulF